MLPVIFFGTIVEVSLLVKERPLGLRFQSNMGLLGKSPHL
jgi:hypothetical protein